MIATVCVCGAGTMGSGIAMLAAMQGYATLVYDLKEETLQRARIEMLSYLEKLVHKGKMEAARPAEVMAHLRFSKDMNDCVADLIIEAIIEKLPEKIALFNQLAELNHAETIFATNTSSLPVTDIAQAVLHPSRVAGLHFFNPATTMKLVEIVRTGFTADHVIEVLREFALALGKTAVTCKDAPGFIVNRVARPYYLEALHLLENGCADIKEIDQLMEATGFRMGPFRLMDLIGNDINYTVSDSLYNALGKPARLKPSMLQQKKLQEGKLGRKTGSGYYEY